MTYEEAAQLLGPDAVAEAKEFVASLPPLTEKQIAILVPILLGTETKTDAAAESLPQSA